jgi:hypothetical protein
MVDAEIGEAALDQARIGVGCVEISEMRVDADRVQEKTGCHCGHSLEVVCHHVAWSASALQENERRTRAHLIVGPLVGPDGWQDWQD